MRRPRGSSAGPRCKVPKVPDSSSQDSSPAEKGSNSGLGVVNAVPLGDGQCVTVGRTHVSEGCEPASPTAKGAARNRGKSTRQ